ncbi:MAG: OsmC family protein [Promethearchaeota archaeon]
MQITLNYLEKMHFSASARHFSDIHIDEPESFHGTNLAPSPIEYFLIGTGSCIGSTFNYCLQKNNMAIESLKIIVDGTLKHIGSNKRLKLVKINIEILVVLNESVPHEKFDLCSKTFQKYCPISDVITQRIPLNIKVIRK